MTVVKSGQLLRSRPYLVHLLLRGGRRQQGPLLGHPTAIYTKVNEMLLIPALQCQHPHVGDLHQVAGWCGVAYLGVPADRARRSDGVGQDDEVRSYRHIARVGVDVRAIKEELD